MPQYDSTEENYARLLRRSGRVYARNKPFLGSSPWGGVVSGGQWSSSKNNILLDKIIMVVLIMQSFLTRWSEVSLLQVAQLLHHHQNPLEGRGSKMENAAIGGVF